MRWPLAALWMAVAGCGQPPAVVPPAEEHPEFDFLTRVGSSSAAPRSTSSAWASRIAPRPGAASAAPAPDDRHAGCYGKMGTALTVALDQPGAASQLKVTVEFVSEQDDDEVPGLGFIRPGVAVGALTPAAIAKLCGHPDLKWIDATPTFMGP